MASLNAPIPVNNLLEFHFHRQPKPSLFIPYTMEIINSSLEQGHFLSKLKESIVYPLLKKPALAPEDNNFRPISNLSFLSKTLERIAAVQLDNHPTDHQLYAKMQSAHRKYHSTESALLKVITVNNANAAVTLLEQRPEKTFRL